jgi:predicted CXXCH cytochrome family protein
MKGSVRSLIRSIKLGLVIGGFWIVAHTASAGLQARFLFDLQSGFDLPSAVRISDKGQVYVLDGVHGRVVMFGPEGKKIGSFSAPEGSSLRLPMDLRLYQDQVIVADSGNHRLVFFSDQGVYKRAIDLSKGDQEAEAQPTGIAVIDDLLYWSDRANSRICATVIESGHLLRCWGGFGTQKGSFRYPFMLTTDPDHYLYVVDVLNGRIQVFNERGRSFGALARFGVTDESLLRPNGISLDHHELMMVSDTYTGRILLFRGRSFVGLLRDEQGDAMSFDQPVGIARWRDRLYVVEMGKHRVQVLRIKEQNSGISPDPPTAYFSQPIRRDCVTCHLSWSEDYTQKEEEASPVPPVGSKKMCLSCHHGAVIESRAYLGLGEQHPDYDHPSKDTFFDQDKEREDPIPKEFPFIEKQIPYCGTCHTPHRFDDKDTGLTHRRENLWMRESNQDSAFCRHCHESLYTEEKEEAREKGMHPVLVDLEEPVEFQGRKLERLNCESCHQVHGGGEKSALLVVPNDEIGQLCAACHPDQHAESLDEAQRKGIHPVNIELDQSVTLEDREITQLDCLSCHRVHGGVEKTPNLVADHRNGQLCEYCHDRAIAVLDTDHDLRISAPESRNLLDETPSQAGLCGSCHSMHRNDTQHPYLMIGDRLPDRFDSSHLTRDRLCQSCHRDEGIGEKRIVTEYTHPYRDIVMHSDPEVMPLLDKDEQSVETGQIGCITCHDPHVWSPWKEEDRPDLITLEAELNDQQEEGTVLNSFLKQKQTQEGFCVICHGLETRVKYKYYHDKRSRPDKAEYLK